MDKVKTLTSRLTNDEHFEAYTEIGDLVTVTGAEILKVEKQFPAFKVAFNAEDDAFKKIRQSALTKDISNADFLRDNIFQGIIDANKSALRHFRQDVVKSAYRLSTVFRTYGNVAQKSLAQESSAITNMLQELNGAYAADVQKVGIADWVAELETANNTVKALMTSRDDEKAAKTTLVMKETRAQVDAAYRDIIVRIEASSVLEEDPTVFNNFIHRLNIIIERYNNAVAQRAGRAKARKEKANNALNDE
jgi:hypothetical protein